MDTAPFKHLITLLIRFLPEYFCQDVIIQRLYKYYQGSKYHILWKLPRETMNLFTLTPSPQKIGLTNAV